MAFRRLRLSDLSFGKPLQREAFSAPQGTQAELQRQDAAAPASVLHSLNQINRRLERILMDLRNVSSADTDLRNIARELIDAINRDTDIALASIFLNQIGGAYAIRHCTEAAIIAGLVAQAMGKSASEVLVVTAAAMTMNVGMVRQSELFQGRDGALTGEERAMVHRHPSDSVDMLRYAGITDEQWLDLVLLHHENDDGSGYPQGRLGDEISQNARLIGLADRYCAFVSARNYRRSLLPPAALARLQGAQDTPNDRELIAHFSRLIGAYPPGTLVRLNDGTSGVASSRVDVHGNFRVHVLRGADGETLALPQKRSTADDGYGVASALEEDEAKLRFTMQQIWGDLASL
jgi:HD-GYP domain-containing protein (c-di-GMP phosphodiesterase class II)